MTNTEKWETCFTALTQYTQRTGNARVPATHKETLESGAVVNLGAWVGYMRQRYRNGVLTVDRAQALASVPGWDWGPLRPGPAADHQRNDNIRSMRSQGRSLQSIGDEFGLSRQRVHQIIRSSGDGT
jgi:hypothetical protein